MNRRGFLRSIARGAAAAFVAPVMIEAVSKPGAAPLSLDGYLSEIYKINRSRSYPRDSIDIWTDEQTARDFQRAFERYYRNRVMMEEAA